MVVEMSCALLYSPMKNMLYIELPKEDAQSQGANGVAPKAWLEALSGTLEEMGLVLGRVGCTHGYIGAGRLRLKWPYMWVNSCAV